MFRCKGTTTESKAQATVHQQWDKSKGTRATTYGHRDKDKSIEVMAQVKADGVGDGTEVRDNMGNRKGHIYVRLQTKEKTWTGPRAHV